ncbi:MAG: response regulator, partial [Oligoflexia bacterium]|nr:response regulator [Oligoflexia bacterium]
MKHKILCAEDTIELRELWVMQLEGKLGLEVVEASNAKEAIEYLQQHDDISLIVCDYMMPGGNGDLLYSYLKEKSFSIPFILTTAIGISNYKIFDNFYSDNALNAYLQKPFSPKDLTGTIRKILNLDASLPVEEYRRVRAVRFFKFNNANCDVILKLTENKYIKIIKKNSLYDTELVKKYIKRGAVHLYVKNKDYENFSAYFEKSISSKLLSADMVEDERFTLELNSMSFAWEVVSNLGIDESVSKIITNIVYSNITTLKEEKNDLWKLLTSMVNKKDYIYEHSLLVSHICGKISMKMNWNSETTLHKLCSAALLHDIAFTDDEEHLSKIHQIEKESTTSLSIH